MSIFLIQSSDPVALKHTQVFVEPNPESTSEPEVSPVITVDEVDKVSWLPDTDSLTHAFIQIPLLN